MYRFEIYCHNNDEWHWRLWSPFNRVIAVSATDYSSSALCGRAVAVIKYEVNLPEANFEIFRDGDGDEEIWRWRFCAPHNRVMAISPMGYPSYALCERAIGIFKQKAHFAQITLGNQLAAAHTAAP